MDITRRERVRDRLPDWLTDSRAEQARGLLWALVNRGGKVYLTDDARTRLRESAGLKPGEFTQAMNDLERLGEVEIRKAGDVRVIAVRTEASSQARRLQGPREGTEAAIVPSVGSGPPEWIYRAMERQGERAGEATG